MDPAELKSREWAALDCLQLSLAKLSAWTRNVQNLIYANIFHSYCTYGPGFVFLNSICIDSYSDSQYVLSESPNNIFEIILGHTETSGGEVWTHTAMTSKQGYF